MKRFLFFLILSAVTISATAQERFIARGAESGELYIYSSWYGIYAPWGPPFYDTVQLAIFRLTENGKKLTIQYEADYFAEMYTASDSVMLPGFILADATPGVVYIRHSYSKDNYSHTSLWVSFDYGKNWMFREGIIGSKSYYSANFEGLVYRATSGGAYIGTYNSYDYAESFTLINDKKINANDCGFEECEFFTISLRDFYHTYDCFQNYINLTIDEEFVFGNISGRFPDVYRGGLPNEVYVSSWFPDWTYKVSFSTDIGHDFQHVYISEPAPPESGYGIQFMSDREPGVFYIIEDHLVEDDNGWHLKLCIKHFKDYGDILVGTYCHDVTKNYGKTCEAVTDLSSESCGADCVLLTWSEPESGLPVEGYQVYRNEELLNDELISETSYWDENLPDGEYEYYVVAHYEMECVSDESNRVIETIGGEICDDVIDLTSEIVNQNAVQLHWTHSADDLLVEGYQVYRNQSLITNGLLEDTTYTDEDLSNGMYQYFVVAYFTNDCDSIVSNIVEETIEVVGIEAPSSFPEGDVRVYPNPTGGMLTITCYRHCGLDPQSPENDEIAGQVRNDIHSVEIFDVFGRAVVVASVETRHATSLQSQIAHRTSQIEMDISYLPSGIYFVRVTTETGAVVRKVVRR